MALAGVFLFFFGSGFALASLLALGSNISPYVEPKSEGQLVTAGIYRYVRHPLYFGLACVVVGAPLIVNAYWSLGLSALSSGVLFFRTFAEEKRLAAVYPAYRDYQKKTKRVIPFVL